MATSSKPKEIVVVGSKVKETDNPPLDLLLDVDDDVSVTLSWDIDLLPSSAHQLPEYAFTFFNEFEPHSFVVLPSTTLTENPLGMTIGINAGLPAVGDEVLVSFLASDPVGNQYQVELYFQDPSGMALDPANLTTPLNLRLEDFSTAELTFSEVGVREPFATAEILSLQSTIIPEPTGILLVASALGTFVVGRILGRDR